MPERKWEKHDQVPRKHWAQFTHLLEKEESQLPLGGCKQYMRSQKKKKKKMLWRSTDLQYSALAIWTNQTDYPVYLMEYFIQE